MLQSGEPNFVRMLHERGKRSARGHMDPKRQLILRRTDHGANLRIISPVMHGKDDDVATVDGAAQCQGFEGEQHDEHGGARARRKLAERSSGFLIKMELDSLLEPGLSRRGLGV